MSIERIDREKCNSCGVCVESCPNDVIRLDERNLAVIVYPGDCHTCFQCEVDCPQKAIVVAPEVPYLVRPY